MSYRVPVFFVGSDVPARRRGLALAGCLASTLIGPICAAATASREDIEWLDRVTYGVTTASLDEYLRLGRRRFLDRQLHPDLGRQGTADDTLPRLVSDEITAMQVSHADPARLLVSIGEERRRINSLPDENAKQDARKALNEQGNRLADEAAQVEMLRALHSSAQLEEQLVWFWLNHFNVFQYKADEPWLLGDYVRTAIRPHALGHFRDLIMATLTHPAMLQYLDNAQNAAGHLNENYARELMELHTLGVDAGYSQQDVEELARILTGVGVSNSAAEPHLKPEWQKLYKRQGGFEFLPPRHDFGAKTLLGTHIEGSGFAEVEQAVDLIVAQPTCARFISRQLAEYFVADDPPRELVERMAKTFQKTHGDITEVLSTLFKSRQFEASLNAKYKDPMHYVVSSMRLAYDGRTLVNMHPTLNWLGALGERPFGRQTPDGYPLTESGWTSSGQVSRRLEIARAIGNGAPALFEPPDGSASGETGFPQLSTRLYFAAIEPYLSPNTRHALERAGSQLEWNTFLLGSPDFNYY